jgi:RND superfamily putative drug exporter
VPSRAAFDRLRGEFGEGEFAPIVLAIRTDGAATTPANLAALYDYSRRLAADPRVSRVDSLVDVDPRLTLAQYTLLYGDPNGPRDRYVARHAGAMDRGDRALHLYTPYGPTATGRSSRPAPPAGPRRGQVTVLVECGAADVADVVDRVG